MGVAHGNKVRISPTIRADQDAWLKLRIDEDPYLRSVSHAVEVALDLLKDELEHRDRQRKGKKGSA